MINSEQDVDIDMTLYIDRLNLPSHALPFSNAASEV